MFPSPLREAELRIELHDDHFPQETRDKDWLPVVGRRGWVVLTADVRIRYRGIEIDALMRAGVRCFALTATPVIRSTHDCQSLLRNPCASLYPHGL